jgi:3-phosphoshikimate 1-carboxyvinyltransferase
VNGPDEFVVEGARALSGSVSVPGDKSISHRALLCAALADGESLVRGLSDGQDVRRTEAAIKALGAIVSDDAEGGIEPRGSRDHETTIAGGLGVLRAPGGAIDCGNSGTTIRLLAGLVAGHAWNVTLTGDESLASRPMDRIARPLELMGATVTGSGESCRPPIEIAGGSLKGIEYSPPQASAQVKSCVLFAGLAADGETVVSEAINTRRHTEELFEICGVDIEEEHSGSGHVVRVRPSSLGPFELSVPGDPSQAAFWVVASLIVPGSEISLPGIYVGEQRRGFLDVLRRMGGSITEDSMSIWTSSSLDSTADVVGRHSALVATDVDASEITGLDEVPVLAVAACFAEGTTRFRNVGELRVKESDRLSGIVEMLGAFGGSAEVHGDDLVVNGVGHLTPTHFHSSGDHRMAMAAAVAAIAAAGDGLSVISGWSSVATSYPAFREHVGELIGGYS